nr:uncharacterized protein LOC117228837 [Megalopta genalis]XP_033340738.1 uncharacterized protein LOC117228837 [Megalopta genalis]XP_033340739.1 uncharacterized protein LOC117228837 [Megalopta genalis]
MLPTSRLLSEDPPGSPDPGAPSRDPAAGLAVPSIVVEDAEGNDDDPPPYTAIAPPNHVGWPFVFSGIPYSFCGTTPCRANAPLASFQPLAPTPTPMPTPAPTTTSGSALRPEGTDGQQASISVPLMPCQLFKFGSHRSLFGHRGLPFSDNISVSKGGHGRTRRYGAILVAAAVIIFLMALSLLVRFVMEKSLWRR